MPKDVITNAMINATYLGLLDGARVNVVVRDVLSAVGNVVNRRVEDHMTSVVIISVKNALYTTQDLELVKSLV